jgi:hypothetical protein
MSMVEHVVFSGNGKLIEMAEGNSWLAAEKISIMTELTDCMTSFDILVTLFSVGR